MNFILRVEIHLTCSAIFAIFSETQSLRSGTPHSAPPPEIFKHCLLAIPSKVYNYILFLVISKERDLFHLSVS